MTENQMLGILEENTAEFINNIARELEESHDRWFEQFGFPMFGETSKEYHEQVYFQSYLESYVRKMINSILKEIFDEEVPYEIRWPEFEYPGVYNGYTNSECETEFGFSFINRSKRIGYRYTGFDCRTIDELLAKGNVDSIVLVIWQNKDEITGYSYKDDRVSAVLLWDLFHELLCELDEEEIKILYDLFTEHVNNAVEQANAMISLKTLPGFTPSYISKTRNETLHNLRQEVLALLCFQVNDNEHKYIEENSKRLIGQHNLSEYFLEKKYENAFVGRTAYAKSYMTSEYLYRYFKDNPMFDYTPIVSGYIKSIEQLLDAICRKYIDTHNENSNNPLNTLGDYTNFIRTHAIERYEVRQAKWTIISCLNSYRLESRNHLFHKDYFNDWQQVKQIRQNTIFLYFAILGVVDTALISDDPATLGLLDTNYDKMFHIIDSQDDNYFTIVLNGKEYPGMRRVFREKGLTFNADGQITNSLTFKRFDYDHCDTIDLSRGNMPSEVWVSDVYEKKHEKIWPIQCLEKHMPESNEE